MTLFSSQAPFNQDPMQRSEFDRPKHNPSNALLRDIRVIDGGRGEYAAWLADLERDPGWWRRQPGAGLMSGVMVGYTDAEITHAHKVLTRLANLTGGGSMNNAEKLDHMRAEINRQDALLQGVYDFIRGRSDDVSIGVGRILQPIEICAECGQENDYSQGKWCRCWSPVTQQDAAALEAMGVEMEDESEEP